MKQLLSFEKYECANCSLHRKTPQKTGGAIQMSLHCDESTSVRCLQANTLNLGLQFFTDHIASLAGSSKFKLSGAVNSLFRPSGRH